MKYGLLKDIPKVVAHLKLEPRFGIKTLTLNEIDSNLLIQLKIIFIKSLPTYLVLTK